MTFNDMHTDTGLLFNLSMPHTRVSALHTCVCVRLLDHVGGLSIYHKFWMSMFKYFAMIECSRCVLQLSLENTRWRGTARLQGQHEREQEWRQLKLNALATCKATYFPNYSTCLTITWQGRLRVTDSRMWTGFRGQAWPLIHSTDSPATSWFHCEA